MKLFATVLGLLLLLTLAGSAQPPTVQGTPSPAAASDGSFHAYGERDKTCLEWTDTCRTCLRAQPGGETCSNIGPACQPAAISCKRRSEPAK